MAPSKLHWPYILAHYTK